jgi:hypothetical protein
VRGGGDGEVESVRSVISLSLSLSLSLTHTHTDGEAESVRSARKAMRGTKGKVGAGSGILIL